MRARAAITPATVATGCGKSARWTLCPAPPERLGGEHNNCRPIFFSTPVQRGGHSVTDLCAGRSQRSKRIRPPVGWTGWRSSRSGTLAMTGPPVPPKRRPTGGSGRSPGSGDRWTSASSAAAAPGSGHLGSRDREGVPGGRRLGRGEPKAAARQMGFRETLTHHWPCITVVAKYMPHFRRTFVREP